MVDSATGKVDSMAMVDLAAMMVDSSPEAWEDGGSDGQEMRVRRRPWTGPEAPEDDGDGQELWVRRHPSIGLEAWEDGGGGHVGHLGREQHRWEESIKRMEAGRRLVWRVRSMSLLVYSAI